jgi:uncharacterized protein (TIGR02284 family)
MSTQTEHDIQQLNSLIEATLDSADGYRDAAKAAGQSQFSILFARRAAERREVVLRLQSEVRRLGGEPERDGTVIAAAHRWFVNLKNTVSGSDDAIVAEVEEAEDHVKEAFETVLRDPRVSVAVRTLIGAAYKAIKADHDQMASLKHQRELSQAG